MDSKCPVIENVDDNSNNDEVNDTTLSSKEEQAGSTSTVLLNLIRNAIVTLTDAGGHDLVNKHKISVKTQYKYEILECHHRYAVIE